MINKTTIENVLNAALETGGDFAEIFVEDKWSTNILFISQKVEKALSGRDFGVGIRIFKNLFSVYAYTNDASEENLIKVEREAASSLKGERWYSVMLENGWISKRTLLMWNKNRVSPRHN